MNKIRRLLFFLFVLLVSEILFAGPMDPLFQWKFDEEGSVAKDSSGNGLDGNTKAEWARDGANGIRLMNGKADTVISLKLPEDKRVGKGSWTFSVWLKPFQNSIDDRQNQRRVLSIGRYPDANLVLNINANGTLGTYFCYKNESGKITATGANSDQACPTNVWTHLVVIADRNSRKTRFFVNGQPAGENDISGDFKGDFSFGEMTVGSEWHNYWGALDEVRFDLRARSGEEIKNEFRENRARFGVSEAQVASGGLVEEILEAADAERVSKNHSALRALLVKAVQNKDLAASLRSYAHLRLARSFVDEGDPSSAKNEYLKIKSDASYPAVHRYEAEAAILEMDRVSRGLSPRDPAASRVKVNEISSFASEVFVAPNGRDEADGSSEKPLQSLEAARDKVREIRKSKKGAVLVHIARGVYPRGKTFELGAEDSGEEGAPVVYRAEKKGAAIFYGGTKVGGWTRVEDSAVLGIFPESSRGKVYRADLKSQGIVDYGELKVRGFDVGSPSVPAIELFADGQPMTLSRWPNEGFTTIADIPVKDGHSIHGFAGSKTPKFNYSGERPRRWTAEKDIWVLGYFFWDWAEGQRKVESIDLEKHEITLADAKSSYGFRKDQRFYAYNLLSEIDMPGEWYLDRQNGVLYLYPTGDPNKTTLELSMLSTAMVTFKNVSHVRFEGLVFDLARANAVEVAGGSDLLFSGCRMTRLAGGGIRIDGGERHGILGCEIGMLGRNGTWITGGDRKTLKPSGHFIENCHIYSNSRIDPTYTPGVLLNGVGMKMSHNLIHDCPSSAARIEGNEHLVEFNDIHSVVLESDDQGGMENFGNPTYRGIIFRHNYLHSIGGTATLAGQAGIRFDDVISGMLVYGNIFYRAASGHFGGLQINSGRDNIIDNNVFVDCGYGVSGGWNAGNAHWKKIEEGKTPENFYMNALYLERYPEIKTMMDGKGKNFIWRNLFWNCGKTFPGNKNYLDLVANAVVTNDELKSPPASAGIFFKGSAWEQAKRFGLSAIPTAEIGLYEDPRRAMWPVVSVPAPGPEWRKSQAKEAQAKPHSMAPLVVKRVTKLPKIDGEIESGEYAVSAAIKETPSRGQVNGPAGEAGLAHDGKKLYVSVRIPLSDLSKLKKGGTWGGDDGVEVCLREVRDIADGIKSPTFILQGFPGGQSQVVGHPDENFDREVRALGNAAVFGMKLAKDYWVCEWAIPFESLGVLYSPGKRLMFNIGAHRNDSGDWMALAGALGANYQVENAAVLILE